MKEYTLKLVECNLCELMVSHNLQEKFIETKYNAIKKFAEGLRLTCKEYTNSEGWITMGCYDICPQCTRDFEDFLKKTKG